MSNPAETARMLLEDALAIRRKSVETAGMLLKDASAIHEKFENLYREAGTAYNVFKVAGISEREVRMCNVLADLLDPNGMHYRENEYLKLFMEKVVKQQPRMEKAWGLNLSKAKVKKQSSTSEGRLIDIEITDGTIFIPIEAKINAREQPKQLGDYAIDSKEKNKAVGFIPVLFLTPDGRKSDEAKEDDYVPISFGREIIPWLEECLKLEKTQKAPPVREVLEQYIKAIKSFCGYMEDVEMAEDMKDLILKSPDNYAAALLISKAVKELDERVVYIFKNQILNLVEKEFPNTEGFSETKDKLPWWFRIKLKNNYTFDVSHDIKALYVQQFDEKVSLDTGKKEKIIAMMSEKTNAHNEAKAKHEIWVSKNVCCYPDPDEKDADMLRYKLYQKYFTEPQSVAEWIVDIAKSVNEILPEENAV